MLLTDRREKFVVKRSVIHGKSLIRNYLGDPVEREVIVIERNVRDSTPVLIGLAGFFGSSINFMNRSYSTHDFLRVLTTIADKKTGSFLIVLPDTMTSYYGNQYLNSTAVGNYEDFIVKDVVSFIHEKYGKRRIGVFGKSSGGFGSYTLATRHPEIFGGFVDVSGDAGFEYCYLKDFPSAILALSSKTPEQFLRYFRNKPNHNNSDLGAMNTLAMSAFYSPNRKVRFGFDLPFDSVHHTLIHRVWAKWLSLDPLRNVEMNIENLREQKIVLQVGRKDEFSINVGMNGMSKILKKNRVKHEYTEYDEGHFGIEYLYQSSLPSLMNALSD